MAIPSGDAVKESGNNLMDGLIQGGKWTSTSGSLNLTFGFWNEPEGENAVWGNADKVLVRTALDTYENFINVTFTEKTPVGTLLNNNVDMSFNLDGSLPTGLLGIGMFPAPDEINELIKQSGYNRFNYPTAEGDTFFNSNEVGMTTYDTVGQLGYAVFLHEIGHTLGLKHPHDDGANFRRTFTELGINDLDRQDFTLMSYNDYIPGTYDAGQPITPMPMDVLTLQHIYGANYTYHTGNDSYSITDTRYMQTIWDAGGTDTFNASGLAAVSMDIAGGGYTRYGEATVWAVAYNVDIENAIATNGSDYINAGEVNNTITANHGADLVYGRGGNDTIYGGTGAADSGDGNDTIYAGSGADLVYGNAGDDTIYAGNGEADSSDYGDYIYAGSGNDLIYSNAGGDLVFGGGGIDTIYSGSGDDTVYGGVGSYDPTDDGDLMIAGDGNDVIYGNGGGDIIYAEAGNDIIYAGAENDIIVGQTGNDTIYGGSGADGFYFYTGDGTDYIMDFETGADAIWLQSNIYGSGITTGAAALASAVQSGLNVIIAGSVVLENISLSDLTSSNFGIV